MANYLSLLSVQLEDALGVVASHDIFIEVPEATTITQLVAAGQSYCAVLAGVTDANGLAAKVSVTFPPTGMNTAAAEGSEVERTGLFNFSQASSKYKFGIDVPSLNDGIVVNGKIDLTAAGVTDWVTWLLSVHTGIQASSKFGNLLAGLLDALISFRKHRKAESRRSFEIGS